MANLLWVAVVVLILVWLFGMTGVLPILGNLIWLSLLIALILATVAFLLGKYVGQ